VRVGNLSPFLKRRQVIRTFNGPDTVTMQRVAPYRGICRVVPDVESQRCKQLFLVGNTKSLIERPLIKIANNCRGSDSMRGLESTVPICQLLGDEA
jgi:hypothetical protein